jgi:DNA transformation protein
LAPLGNVVFRKMFGGLGIFKDGLMFALVAEDALYMKADDATTPAYAAEGSGPFVYAGMRGKAMPMPYWRVPERLLDEPEEFRGMGAQGFCRGAADAEAEAQEIRSETRGLTARSDGAGAQSLQRRVKPETYAVGVRVRRRRKLGTWSPSPTTAGSRSRGSCLGAGRSCCCGRSATLRAASSTLGCSLVRYRLSST